MDEKRHFWVLDDRVLEYVKFNEFRWWEILIIIVGLGGLLFYAFLALYLDRRSRLRVRRSRQLSKLEGWLEELDLGTKEEAQLREMAADDGDLALYTLLADPAAFETAVHNALAQGERVDFAEQVRDVLGFHSDHPGTPVASTRQLLPGDHFRLSAWEEGRPEHHYAVVTAVSPAGLSLELTEAGFRAARNHAAQLDLFYLRGSDVEYRFPLSVRGEDPTHNRLLIHHALVRGDQRPRGTRLPMLRQVQVRLDARIGTATEFPHLLPRGPAEGHAPGEAPAEPPPAETGGKAALLEMSEGGFSLVMLKPVAEGAYLEFPLALPRGRSLQITGRVLDCRPFAGKRWLVRCEQRGLSRTQRNTLTQLLRLEQNRRIKAMETERRRRHRAEDVPPPPGSGFRPGPA